MRTLSDIAQRIDKAHSAVLRAVDATIQAHGGGDSLKDLQAAKQELDAACEEANEAMKQVANEALAQMVAMMTGTPMGATS